MQSPPKLFDTSALALHRHRAHSSESDVWFLHKKAAALTLQRLKEVNRKFSDITIIGSRAKNWAQELNIHANCIMDQDTLDLKQNSYDLIIHALSLHWANDPVGQLIQMRRALRPDGLMIAVMFGGQSLHELRFAFIQAETAILTGIRPHVSPMGEIRELGALLQRAGYGLPVADSILQNVTYKSALHLMKELRAMGETNILSQRQKTFLRRDVLDRVNKEYHSIYSTSDGRIKATVEFIFLTGWAPSDTQQKPLRPGSAHSRLADALGVSEYIPKSD